MKPSLRFHLALAATITLSVGCSSTPELAPEPDPEPDPVPPRAGRYQLGDHTSPPADLASPWMLSKVVGAEECSRYSYNDVRDPRNDFPIFGSDLTLSAPGEHGRFSLLMELEDRELPMDCLLNANMDFFCWGRGRPDEDKPVSLRKYSLLNGRPETGKVDGYAPNPDSRISIDDRAFWYYIYGWVLDAENGDTLFGVFLKGSNISGSTYCPNQVMWAAEWVGEAP